MANTTALRPDSSGPPEAPVPAPTTADIAAFRSGRGPEDHVVDLLAFALGAEAGGPVTPEEVGRLRQRAEAVLSEHSFRYLHNSIEEIRREAAAEQLARLPRPPGFRTMVLANLLALFLFGIVAAWLALHPATLAGLAGLQAG
ncbi:hypothetical protein [Roseicella frigidaeris]|uniref:Uncharacterized protein n=1 Tax=Roseicella frigidaeris TaxID=2230885 RepID=A0A327M4X7_9PROT|nr:hypothetical protein [Roseicella frigidaeris]RAI57272.1 hypothetical protein DOO78_19815 [Roseicella frigidaeris]